MDMMTAFLIGFIVGVGIGALAILVPEGCNDDPS